VALPDSMKRSMSRQAEAERERRARVIAADGEFQASRRLADAARAMAGTPAAFQLRLLHFFDQYTHVAPAAVGEPVPVAGTEDAEKPQPADRINGDLMKAAVRAW
jgi:hypothetical protein